MKNRKSLLFPLGIMLAGILFQLKAKGIIGTSLPDTTAVKFWPLLLAAAGLDLWVNQRRLVAGFTLLFLTLALFAAEFLESGWNSDLWKLFITFWPILLFLFGLDVAATGQSSVFNVVAITLLAVAVVYALLMTLGVPVMSQIPAAVTGTQVAASSTTYFEDKNLQPLLQATPVTQVQAYAPGEIALPLPAQDEARLELNAAFARVSLQAGSDSNLYAGGSLSEALIPGFQQTIAANAAPAYYRLNSSAASGQDMNLNLKLNPLIRSDIQLTLNKGYIIADLSELNLSAASIENRTGSIDIQLPANTDAIIRITADNGDIRVFLPANGQIYCRITGTNRVDYPRDRYQYTGNTLIPIGYGVYNPVTVEISSQNGMVQIIEKQ